MYEYISCASTATNFMIESQANASYIVVSRKLVIHGEIGERPHRSLHDEGGFMVPHERARYCWHKPATVFTTESRNLQLPVRRKLHTEWKVYDVYATHDSFRITHTVP